MIQFECNNCGYFIEDAPVDVEKYVYCPICGSQDISIEKSLNLRDRINIHGNISAKSDKHPGEKKPMSEFLAGEEWSVKREKYVDKQRKIDRENDQYYEKVADPDTGEIIHECSERLSQHFGHGSDKINKEK